MANKLKDQTIKNEFLFGAVMTEPENCRLLLERILEVPIERVVVDRERTIIYHPEYHGVRLDIYASDEANKRYNIEVQVLARPALSRYFDAAMCATSIEKFLQKIQSFSN